ncbi:MAG: TonB-dependent receptor [Chitinophagaceae bacterium]
MSSTTPATIYINGREQKMSTADIATLLKSLPPSAIASIEILRTPSAKYDASGSGGIVNIVLKKGVKIGLTGSVYTGIQQGKYGNQTVGVNVNNNNGQLTTYINLNYARRNSYEQLTTDRFFASDSTLNQNAFTKYTATNYYVGFGVNYQFNKKWEASYDGRFSYNDFANTSNTISISKQISTNNAASNSVADVSNKGNNYNLSQSINTKYKIDSLGSEWTTDFSYTHSPSSTNQAYVNNSYLPLNPTGYGDGTIKPNLNYFSAQTNLAWKLPQKFTVETGVKTTHVDFDNSSEYYRQSGGVIVKDVARTSAYQYNETINSAYLQASKTFFGFTLKSGVRMENTNMNGRQTVPADTSFKINRTDFFPYVYFSKGLMKIAGYELRGYLVYRRTISRPAYEYLNPFPRYIDPFLYESGNPSLRPQFTQNYEFNVSVDERPIFAIGINNTKDIFTQVIYPVNGDPKYSYRTYDNLGSNKETYFRVLGAIPPGKRYFFVIGGQYNHNLYTGLYNNKPLSFDKGSWTIFTYQTFKITQLTQLALQGFARFNGQQQFYELTSFGALSLSLNQQFFKRKMTVTLSANDLFFTNNNHFTINQGSINAAGYREGDTRRYGLNIRYNFGIRKKEEQKNIFNVDFPDKTS